MRSSDAGCKVKGVGVKRRLFNVTTPREGEKFFKYGKLIKKEEIVYKETFIESIETSCLAAGLGRFGPNIIRWLWGVPRFCAEITH